MAATFQGKAFVYGTPASYTAFGLNNVSLGAGYVSPATEGASVSHNAEVERVQDSDGDYAAVIMTAEYVECTFELRPEAASAADARLSATLPPVGATFQITGMPIIKVGAFTDVFNTNGTDTKKWIYEGGGSVRGTNTGKYMVTLPLRRYQGITPGEAITT